MDHWGSPNSRFFFFFFLPSFELEINGVTWCVFFQRWLLLLNIILVQFMCIVNSCAVHSLPLLFLFLCGDRSVLIYPFPWWWTPECYPAEVVTDSTAANVPEHQFSSVAQSCPTLCNPMDCSTPGLPVHHQLPELTQTHVHQVGDAIQPSHSLPSPSPLAINLSQHQGLFRWISFHIRWPKYWSFSFSISPSNGYSGLISSKIDSLDLLAVQGTLKSLLQHYSSKASILWHSAFFIVQFSHPYMTTGKTIALIKRTFGGKVMSLLCNLLSRLVTVFFQGASIF